MVKEKLQQNIEQLPEYLQFEVLNYVEYLLMKHNTENLNEDIPQVHKEILKERYEKMKENPDAGESWDTVKKQLLKKYAI